MDRFPAKAPEEGSSGRLRCGYFKSLLMASQNRQTNPVDPRMSFWVAARR
jgi:hypothetical protein